MVSLVSLLESPKFWFPPSVSLFPSPVSVPEVEVGAVTKVEAGAEVVAVAGAVVQVGLEPKTPAEATVEVAEVVMVFETVVGIV